MTPYILYLIASLAFYAAGILMIAGSSRGTGAAFVALGCTFFAIALKHRKRNK